MDREQLREITLNDEDLMREIVAALIDDTARQIELLDAAIRQEDAKRCMRLAHYSKGACANVGAKAAADLLKHIERKAASNEFEECTQSLSALAAEMDRLRSEVAVL